MDDKQSTLAAKWARMRRIMLFGDTHATRFTLAMAEAILVYVCIYDERATQIRALLPLGPRELWTWVMFLTVVGQVWILLRGRYNTRSATLFAGWDALWWILMTSAMVVHNGFIPGPQTALTLAAGWIFISSGFSSHGKRGTDYVD